MMMGEQEKLIEAIKSRRGIWDRFSSAYHDRQKTRIAWEEVATVFYPGFPNLGQSEKYSLVQVVQKKWRNMRDSYVKDLKTFVSKGKHGKRRKYIFFDRLSFLRQSVEAKMARSLLSCKKEPKKEKGIRISPFDEETYQSATIADPEVVEPEELIAVVKKTPSVWDASCPKYHRTSQRNEGWLNVCRSLYSHFDDLHELDRMNLLDSLQKTWQELKDCFIKDWKIANDSSIRGRLRTRRHVHYSRLLFLAKSLEWEKKNNPPSSMLEDQSIDNISFQDNDARSDGSELFEEQEFDTSEFFEIETKFNPNEEVQTEVEEKYYPIISIADSPMPDATPDPSPIAAPNRPVCKEITREVTMFQIPKEASNHPPAKTGHSREASTSASHNSSLSDNRTSTDVRAIEELKTISNKSLLVDEDVAFFFSLLPTLKTFDEDLKLEFRVEVMKVMQKMKKQLKAS